MEFCTHLTIVTQFPFFTHIYTHVTTNLTELYQKNEKCKLCNQKLIYNKQHMLTALVYPKEDTILRGQYRRTHDKFFVCYGTVVVTNVVTFTVTIVVIFTLTNVVAVKVVVIVNVNVVITVTVTVSIPIVSRSSVTVVATVTVTVVPMTVTMTVTVIVTVTCKMAARPWTEILVLKILSSLSLK